MENHSEYIIKLLHKKNVIRDWTSGKYKQKPIIIYGSSGTGKTSLANYILKDFTKITINLDFCKKKISYTLPFIGFISFELRLSPNT